MSSWGYRRYVPVAERRAKAARKATSLRKAGRELKPVQIDGRTIAKSFWGKAWCENLESYSDYENRLPRGRTYARNGSVIDLQISGGRIDALVYGSELYEVTLRIDVLSDERWRAIRRDCGGHIDSLVELLQGKLSRGVMDVVTRPGEGLFPAPAEIHLDCSCPDWAVMCKHVAGALYGVGARLDSEPEMLFSLRGVDPAEMIADAVGGGATHRKKARGRVLEDDVLSSVFGVDIDLGGEALTGETKPKHRRRTKDVSEVKAPPSKKLRPSTPKSSAIASPTSEASGRLDPTAAADQVLAVITGEPDLRTPQIAERVGAPRSVIKKAIRELKRRGLVGFVGASRTGGYRLAERASDDETGPGDVESAVVGFHRASLAGEYFESFGVNSKNHREWSAGTRRWISRFNRLLERVSELAEEMDYAGARRCYALLFELLEGIDAHDDIVFFADEWGAWQVGVPWEDVLPIWLVCVAETAEPKEFATEVIALGRRRIIDGHAVDELLAEAGFVASDAQRSALDELCSEPPR